MLASWEQLLGTTRKQIQRGQKFGNEEETMHFGNKDVSQRHIQSISLAGC